MKALAINLSFKLGFIDHIAPLCAHLELPYFFGDEHTLDCARKLYPGVDFRYQSFINLCDPSFYQEYKALIQPTVVEKAIFKESFGDIKAIFAPHGNSDKGYILDEAPLFLHADMMFIYGNKMLQYLEDKEVLPYIKNRIVCGNYRQSYYNHHKSFFDDLIQKELPFTLNPGKKTVLYAPTWERVNSTLLLQGIDLLQEVPSSYQVIVKLHPFIIEEHLAEIEILKMRFENQENIFFISELPNIYPLLNIIDYYVGDNSSIGYDFLYFDKPLFFINRQNSNQFHLYKAGTFVSHEEMGSIWNLMEKGEDKSKERQALYDYTFGKDRLFKEHQAYLKQSFKAYLDSI